MTAYVDKTFHFMLMINKNANTGCTINDMIRLFRLDNPHEIRVTTGGTKQLPPIQDRTNCQDRDVYANQCLDTRFKHNTLWKISQRARFKERRTEHMLMTCMPMLWSISCHLKS